MHKNHSTIMNNSCTYVGIDWFIIAYVVVFCIQVTAKNESLRSRRDADGNTVVFTKNGI